MLRLVSISICLLALLQCGPLLAYGVSLEFAEHLYVCGDYEDAVTEYKRFVFLNPDSRSVSYAYYKMGLAYRNERQWDRSALALEQSIRTARNDSIRTEREISLAVVTAAKGEFDLAEFQFIRIELYSKFPTLKRKAAFLRGISCLYQFKWEKARHAFQVCFEDTIKPFEFSQHASRIDSFIVQAQNSPHKSPQLAKWFSTFLPGAGQFYAQDFHNGLNALAINSATGYLLINNIAQHHWKDAAMTYLFLFSRYYHGNRYHAAKSAENFNRRVNEESAERILELFETDPE